MSIVERGVGVALRRLVGGRSRMGERAFELARDGTWSVRVGSPGVDVHCASGVLFVTIEGDPNDHVLIAGATLVIGRPGLLVIWALEAARAQVTWREVTRGEARIAGRVESLVRVERGAQPNASSPRDRDVILRPQPCAASRGRSGRRPGGSGVARGLTSPRA